MYCIDNFSVTVIPGNGLMTVAVGGVNTQP